MKLKGRKHSPERIQAIIDGVRKSKNWGGGKTHDRKGYVLVKAYGHPSANAKHYVKEHRLVMEKHIGRYLKTEEVVHHINEVKNDNRIENLMLFPSDIEHRAHHKGLRNAKR